MKEIMTQLSEKEKEDAFYNSLEFGTGELRREKEKTVQKRFSR
jgi:hypothetical protein